MFRLNHTALFFIQASVMWHVFTVLGFPGDPRVMLVPRGESVRMICNISTKNETLITWTKGRSVFQYFWEKNVTLSNFSVQRLEINHKLPSKLIIFSAQPEDEGLYICNITDRRGLKSITWNLTVSENLKESMSLVEFLFILTPAIVFLLCCIILAVVLCSKDKMGTANQDPVHNPPQSEEVDSAHWQNNKRRSQYMEKLNSIYDHF